MNSRFRWTRWLGCGLLILQSACSACGEEGLTPEPESVVFVGVDGLDPRLLRGLMQAEPDSFPHFRQLSDEGFFVDLTVSRIPILSPILWASMSTGYTEDRHGIQAWTADRQQPVSQTDLYAKRFWEAGSDQGKTVLQIGSLMTSPVVALNGTNVGDVFVWSALSGDDSPDNLDAHVYPSSAISGFQELIPGPSWMKESPFIGDQLSYIDGRHHPMLVDETFVRIFEKAWPAPHHDIGVLYLKGVDRLGHLADPSAKVGSMGFTTKEVEDYFDVGPDWVKSQYLYMDTCLGRVLDVIDPSTTTLVLASDHGWDVHGAEPEWDTRHRDPGLLMGWGKRANAATTVDEIGQLDLGATLYALSGVAVAHDVDGRVQSGLFDLPEQAPGLGTYVLEQPLTAANGAQLSAQEKADRIEQLKQLAAEALEDKPKTVLDRIGDGRLGNPLTRVEPRDGRPRLRRGSRRRRGLRT